MMQVAQNYRSGELAVLDVPAPACLPGGVLVQSAYSLISTGTELMKVSEARLSLLGKARARPDQLRKVLDSVAQQGALATYQKAMSRLDSYTPLGYSLCGTVVAVGEGVEEFAVGDRVAAAGNDFALHAELNWVPTNLCVRVPDGVSAEHAAFATVGAIAMQGVRRGEVQLGETACVVGLGLVGQLVVRLLVSAGVRVVGVDSVVERCRLAEKAGAVSCAGPDPEGVAVVEQLLLDGTDGRGADHVFLAAGGDTNGPVELAVRLARDRARVVDIGKTRLDLPWNAYYEKELDFRFSRSYGPGRYDDRYELDGVDYPAGYVRWTERRNLACFLDLLATGSVDVAALVSGTHPIGEAAEVYRRLNAGELSGVGFLFEYPVGADTSAPAQQAVSAPVERRRVQARATRTDRVRIGFVGAGNYASTMLLPHLARMEGVELTAVATNTSLSAVNAGRKFEFASVGTDPDAILADPAVDAVFVVTRHHSHAAFVCAALEQGKSVFVEKPLALTEDQLSAILEVVDRTGNDRLMVGFNRRFAPLFRFLTDHHGPPRGPVLMRYLVNAGQLQAGSWYLNQEAEGSRFLGEGGHFIDTMSAWVRSPVAALQAWQTSDAADLQVTLTFADGSLGTISYLTSGNNRFPKETFDASGSGRNVRLDNFTRATLWSPRGKDSRRALRVDKGQAAQLDAFISAVRTAGPMPIGLSSLVATTRATLAVSTSLATGAEVRP